MKHCTSDLEIYPDLQKLCFMKWWKPFLVGLYMLDFTIRRNDLSLFVRPIDFDFYALNFETKRDQEHANFK